MDFQTRIQLYQGGTFLLHFEDEEEYRLFLRKRRAIWIASGLFAFFIISLLVSFVLFLMLGFKLYWLIIASVAAVLAAFMAEGTIYFFDRYDDLEFDLVMKEIKRKKCRIDYSNDETGRIVYVENEDWKRIYVFKGKNAKGLRRSRRK